MDVVVTHDDVEHEVTSSAMEAVKSKLPKLSPPTLTEKLGLDRRLYGAKLVKTLASKLRSGHRINCNRHNTVTACSHRQQRLQPYTLRTPTFGS